MKKTILFLSVLGLVLSPQLSGQSVGSDAPDFEVDLLGGGTFKLSNQSNKVVMIFFFGNTCPFCEDAVPSIESEIISDYKNNPDFVAVGLDTWNDSNASKVDAFRIKTGITFQLGIDAGSVKTAYSTSHDRLFVIDKEGKVAHKGILAALNDVGNAKSAIVSSLVATGLPGSASGEKFRLYPNPASDFIYLEAFSSESKRVEMEIFDLSGKKVLVHTIDNNTNRTDAAIPVSALENGLYFFRLDSGGELSSGKFVIER